MAPSWLHLIVVGLSCFLGTALNIPPLTNYCVISPKHTMCKYSAYGPGPRCGRGAESKGFEYEEQQEILGAFNSKRDLIAAGIDVRETGLSNQPTASNMMELEWGIELAEIAQRWADQCLVDRHDEERKTNRFPRIGQLTYASGYFVDEFQSDIVRSVKHWFGEVETFKPEALNKFNLEKVTKMKATSYTQAAWAETYEVGCGRTIFTKNMTNKHKEDPGSQIKSGRKVEYKMELIVCNFAPGGNVEGQPVYLIGDEASACPPGMSPDILYQGLCSEKTHHDLLHSEHKGRKYARPVFAASDDPLLGLMESDADSRGEVIDGGGDGGGLTEAPQPATRHTRVPGVVTGHDQRDVTIINKKKKTVINEEIDVAPPAKKKEVRGDASKETKKSKSSAMSNREHYLFIFFIVTGTIHYALK